MKILHIITGLSVGGAEMTLYRLLAHPRSGGAQSAVISLVPPGPLGDRIREIGIDVHTANMRRGMPGLHGLIRLIHLVRQVQPDLVQTWMYHADLCGATATRLAGSMPVVWDIQNGTLDPTKSRLGTRLTARACAALSRTLPDRIVCCSHSTREIHQAMGYRPERMLVIPNGCDTDVFKPDPEARQSVRKELGIGDEILIGLSARFDPQKDHRNFIDASGRLLQRGLNVRFLLFGSGITADNLQLTEMIQRTGRSDRFHLLGLRADTARLNAALDVAVLSSAYGEGLPLAVGEAMSSEVPCVVTDVGDSGRLVGGTGRIVPARDAAALANALAEMIRMGRGGRLELGRAARRRIQECFSLDEMVRRYYELYTGILESGHSGRNSTTLPSTALAAAANRVRCA